MTLSQLYAEIRFMTNTSSTTFTDDDILRGINLNQGEATEMMLSAQGYSKLNETEYTTDFLATTGLIEGESGYNGEYAFDSTILRPLRIELKYPDCDYVECKMYDMSTNEGSEVDYDFEEDEPYARIARDSIFIRPLPATTVTDGIKMWAEKMQTDVSGSSDTPVLSSIFHEWYVLNQALRFGQLRPGKTKEEVLMDISRIEDKIMRYYRVKTATIKRLTVNQLNFQ